MEMLKILTTFVKYTMNVYLTYIQMQFVPSIGSGFDTKFG